MQSNISNAKIILKFPTNVYSDLSSNKYLEKLLKKTQENKYIWKVDLRNNSSVRQATN